MKKIIIALIFLLFPIGVSAQSASVPYDILYGNNPLYDLTQTPILEAVKTELAQSGLLGNIPNVDLTKNKTQEFFYNNDSVFIRATIIKNTLNGTFFYFYRNGSALAKIPYKNGIIDGEVLTYFPNGNLKMRVSYQNGQRTGKAMMYHINQNTHVVEYYQNGQRNGVQKRYDQEGNLRSVIPYTNGLINGEVLIYDQNDNTKARLTYRNGQVLKNMCVDRQGNMQTLSPLGLYQIEHGMRPIVCGITELENLIAFSPE